MLNDARFCFRS